MDTIELEMKMDQKSLNNETKKQALLTYNVGNSGKGKRYINFEHLVRSRGLNCVIELDGVKITKWQLEGFKDYINSNESYKLLYKTIDEYGIIFVNSYEQSDISL